MGLDIAMRHRARHPKTVCLAGGDIRRGVDTRHMEGARGLEPGVEPVGAPQPEVHDLPPSGSRHDADRLGRQQRLQMDLVHHQRFDELRFGQGRHDLEDRLV